MPRLHPAYLKSKTSGEIIGALLDDRQVAHYFSEPLDYEEVAAEHLEHIECDHQGEPGWDWALAEPPYVGDLALAERTPVK
jgi:hypothetical protein